MGHLKFTEINSWAIDGEELGHSREVTTDMFHCTSSAEHSKNSWAFPRILAMAVKSVRIWQDGNGF